MGSVYKSFANMQKAADPICTLRKILHLCYNDPIIPEGGSSHDQ